MRHSPFNLVDPPDIANPVITANDVTDVSASFVADPFLFHENNAWFMFFEVYNTNSGKGEIGLAISSDGLNWIYQEIVLSETMHLSYPLILKSNGEYYMIPETHKWNQVRIYRANDFPYDWTYLTSIASGRPFVDPTVFQYNNKWWMIVGGSGNSYLYYSDDLLSGYVEHPMSPIVKWDTSIARPGGRSFVFDTDRIIRIAQKCDVHYGQRVRAFEVDILDETQYAEHEIPESPILYESGTGWNAFGMHHFDPWWTGTEWICAVDGYGDSSWSIGIYTAKPEGDLSYTLVTPCRIVDTRISQGGLGSITSGTQRDFIATGLCGVPYGPAKAVMINIVAVNATGMGNLRAFAYPKPVPFVATLNYGIIPGLNAISNAAIIPICDTDVSACFWDLSIWASTTTDVVVDVMGYFTAP